MGCWNDWKAHFNIQMGPNNPFSGSYMITPNVPMLFNLRADPFERAQYDSGAWEVFAADQLWIFTPLQVVVSDFLLTIPEYPFQTGSSLTAAGINYDLFRRADAMERLQGMTERLAELGAGGPAARKTFSTICAYDSRLKSTSDPRLARNLNRVSARRAASAATPE